VSGAAPPRRSGASAGGGAHQGIQAARQIKAVSLKAAFFVLCYAGLIIPVVGVGVATLFVGDFPAVLAFSILLAALSLFSLASIRRTL
jgi:hypothetical protein